jgi:hypothetical protein
MGNPGADRRHDTRGFMAEHHRLVDDEVADAAVFQIVDVAAADAHCLDGDPNLIRGRIQRTGNLDIAKTNVPDALENDGSYLHGFSSQAAGQHSRTGLRGS